MRYTKPALSFEQQADLLIQRGLIVERKEDLISFLSRVNYYRLSGYTYTFKVFEPKDGKEAFIKGTTFNVIRDRYEFDRRLRLLLMDAIERIEVAILRTRFVECHSLIYGPFGYTDYGNFDPHLSVLNHQRLIDDIKDDEMRSNEEFIDRYRSKYANEKYLPMWMAVEVMSFGQLFTLYRNSDHSIKRTISNQFGLFPPVMDSWLHSFNYVRNACAHHVRLWNRPLPIAPKLPDKKHDSSWYTPEPISNMYIFGVLSLSQYLLRIIDPSIKWKNSIIDLLTNFPEIPKNKMGFPQNWENHELWK
jgi:abortive infection bacteriophage resistance protein